MPETSTQAVANATIANFNLPIVCPRNKSRYPRFSLNRASRVAPFLCSTSTRICQTFAPWKAVAGISPRMRPDPHSSSLSPPVSSLPARRPGRSRSARTSTRWRRPCRAPAPPALPPVCTTSTRSIPAASMIVLRRLQRRRRVDDAVAGVLIDPGRSDVARRALDDRHHLPVGQARIVGDHQRREPAHHRRRERGAARAVVALVLADIGRARGRI